MDSLWLAIALGLPWLAGLLWTRALWRELPEGGLPLVAGYGYFAGVLATAGLLRACDAFGLGLGFAPTALALALLALAGAARSGRALCADIAAAWRAPSLPALQRAAWLLLLAVIGMRLLLLAAEALVSPLFSWDAWATWAPRARVWFELRQMAPFVGWENWLTLKGSGAYTIAAAHYPATLPLLQTWTCLALGRWDDGLMNAPWLGCALALGCGFYGQARAWGVSALTALTFTYLLLSLPLLDTQIALPGNADLWMASVYGLACCAFFHWRRSGVRAQAVLALGCALACPLIKVPGVLWLLSFLPALLVPDLGWRRALWLTGVPLLLIAVTLAFGGVGIELPGIGLLGLTPRALDLPYLGHFPLAWHPEVAGAFASSHLGLASWHLFWYAWGGLMLARWRVFAVGGVLGTMALVAASTLGCVAAIYSTSRHFEFALDFTQAGRTTLHLVPMLAFVALAVWDAPSVAHAPAADQGDSSRG